MDAEREHPTAPERVNDPASDLTQDPAGAVCQVLTDVLLPDDPPLKVTPTGRIMWGQAAVIVSVTGTERSFGFEFPVEGERTETLLALAESTRDAVADLLGVARPACRAPGHDHPLAPVLDDGTAVWRCPRGAYQVPVTGYAQDRPDTSEPSG